MSPPASFRSTLMGLAMTASSLFVSPLSVQAQNAKPSDDPKKISLRDIVKQEYGKKKDVPATDLFSVRDPVKPFNANHHIELLRNYKYVYTSNQPYRHIYCDDKTKMQDTVMIGMAVWDKQNGYKGVFTYDEKNDVIDVHNYGMDPENKREWRCAAKAVLGFQLPAAKVAIDYAEKGFEKLQGHFPQIQKGKTHMRFMGYSMGGDAAIQGAFGMALKGHKVDQVVLIDPYAVVFGKRKVNRLVKGRENKEALNDFIAQRCMTMTPLGGSFVDKIPPMGLLSVDFGRVEKVDAGKDGEHHFLSNYLNKYTPYRHLGME